MTGRRRIDWLNAVVWGGIGGAALASYVLLFAAGLRLLRWLLAAV